MPPIEITFDEGFSGFLQQRGFEGGIGADAINHCLTEITG